MRASEAPRIGLALGSGSARGWAHIGVIRGLHETGIEPLVVSGSSIGALVGAAYAAGHLDALEKWVRSLTWKEVVRVMDFTLLGGGLIQGDKLMDFFGRYVENTTIESLPLRFGAVAADLGTGREIWFQDGPLLDAVRASIALPGLFVPVRRDGKWLVDGGLVNPVPVSLCRALGADLVIAVNLNGDIVGKHRRRRQQGGRGEPVADKRRRRAESDLWKKLSTPIRNGLQERAEALLSQILPKRDAPGLFEVLVGAIGIMQDRITRSRMAGDPPEIVLAPRLAHIGLMEFDRAGEAIDEGRACVAGMKTVLEEILKTLDKNQN